MRLTVRPQLEADIEPALRTQYAAFRTGAMGKLLTPNPSPSPEYLVSATKSRLATMRSNPAAHFMVVEDLDLLPANPIIAAAHWDIYAEERTEAQVDALCHKADPPPDANAAAWTDFFGHFAESRRALGTKPVAVLHTLTVHPDHQRRGAGTLLMRTFVEQVDRAGVEAYIESSEMGKPLYARFGFAPVLERRFDLTKYGAEGVEVNTIMVRPPLSMLQTSST
ncbi:uncharacterized protein PV09_06941 [Verruconis gallopava]|uniref:N-acetyltransferase domain-containing protein n=1 Tax=Verruconis gallopava TaxID=253628 RepID=A0A0D2ARE5_9PEZI|nr:uncharacterized protein PV09_06941 [Verruconis gallopava]KIW01769.1 hypothetical protein PV09_06941 [Verruconis gallopava]